MERKDAVLDYLAEYKQELIHRRNRLMVPVVELEQEIDDVTGTIRSLHNVAKKIEAAPVSDDFPVGKLRKLTQVQALTVIAKHYGGTLKAQEAKRLLIKAGVMRETKNSTNIIHAVIVRSEKFEKVKPGEYRLKTARINAELEEFAKREGLPFDEKPVQ